MRATSAIVPDIDGYTVTASATWSAVMRWVTARVRGGRPTHWLAGPRERHRARSPDAGWAKILMNPSRTPSIFARGFRASGSMLTV